MTTEKRFALSEDTKDKLLQLINKKPAPDKYANNAPVTREYYSRMWLVQLDEDLPGMSDDRSGNNNLHCVDAYVFERNSYERLAQRVWNSENVKLRKKVYNQSRETLPSKDEDGNPIFYTAIQDMLGTIWVQPRVKNEYFVINKGWNGEGTPPNTPSIFTKGSLHYVTWDGSDWVPHSANETVNSTSPFRPSQSKLVVCQADAPTGAKDFPMRYFTPESNMGVPPTITSTWGGLGGSVRAGVIPGEHTFTNKWVDYNITSNKAWNNSTCSLSYEPVFLETFEAVGQGGGGQDLYIEINNQQYQVFYPLYSQFPYGDISNAPDIYPGDQILVKFNAVSGMGDAVDYPTDYPVGTIMPWFRGAPWYNPAYPGRGWQQFIPSGGQGEITAVNIDKTSSHYDSSSDCVWVEAGANDKIPVKEGSLCFIEKVKTNAIT